MVPGKAGEKWQQGRQVWQAPIRTVVCTRESALGLPETREGEKDLGPWASEESKKAGGPGSSVGGGVEQGEGKLWELALL